MVETALIENECFRVHDYSQQLLEKYPYFLNLKEIRIIPAIKDLLNQQITQFIRVDGDGSFSFFIMKVEEAENYPFLLKEEINVAENLNLILPRFLPLAMIFDRFVKQYPYVSGITPFSHGDKGRGECPVLCYDSNHDRHLRLEDSDFLYRNAYQEFKTQLDSNWIPWENRQAIAYWRGSATGDKISDREWRMMARFRLCQFVTDLENKDLFDMKITRITNRFSSPEVIEEIKNSGFIAPFSAAIDQVKYKYLLDIDGHASTWTGLFLRLLTGSTVLKVDSERKFRQWYHNRLIPWENFVPIKADLSDLESTVLFLKEHDSLAHKIGEAGRRLADSMTLEQEINLALPILLKCLKPTLRTTKYITQ
ncbi:MAG: hypothetical protein GDA56_04785 [Hormoscilla sp. GM7CHS1pb]|nr:hypothetical protein [Hormoscilla sp. GM7CHS1pb]UDF05927.1 ORF7 [Hormoscilla sp. GUM007]